MTKGHPVWALTKVPLGSSTFGFRDHSVSKIVYFKPICDRPLSRMTVRFGTFWLFSLWRPLWTRSRFARFWRPDTHKRLILSYGLFELMYPFKYSKTKLFPNSHLIYYDIIYNLYVWHSLYETNHICIIRTSSYSSFCSMSLNSI